MRGDYNLVPLPTLLGMAELAVMAEVVGVDDATFHVRVDEVLIGTLGAREIRIEKYAPPALVGRKAVPYVVGHRFALFLEKRDPGLFESAWKILGFAGEGEMRIQGDLVCLAPYDLEGLEYWPIEVEGVEWKSQQIALDAFVDAVRDYSRCFGWELVEYIKNGKRRERWVVSEICDDEWLGTYRTRSWLHDYLVRESTE